MAYIVQKSTPKQKAPKTQIILKKKTNRKQ